MNRSICVFVKGRMRVPRSRGDEPIPAIKRTGIELRSPLARG